MDPAGAESPTRERPPEVVRSTLAGYRAGVVRAREQGGVPDVDQAAAGGAR